MKVVTQQELVLKVRAHWAAHSPGVDELGGLDAPTVGDTQLRCDECGRDTPVAAVVGRSLDGTLVCPSCVRRVLQLLEAL